MPSVATHAREADRLLNRELSWLDFNSRVLELAEDRSVPLLERVKFCAIFSANLDEFFMVRVAGLLGQVASGVSVRSGDGRTPTEALVEIRRRVMELSARQAKLWRRELLPLLADQDIDVGNVGDLRPRELAELTERFEHELFPILTPLAVGPGQPFPYISGLSLSLGLFVRDPETAEQRFARVKVPELLPRFLPIGDRGLYLPLEDVIAHFLPWLFPEMEISECAAFRVTRDADFEVSDEADDLLEAVELELRRRRFGDAVRVQVSDSMSEEMRARLLDGLDAEEDQLYPIAGLLDLADVMQLARLARPDLTDDPWLAVTQPRIADLSSAAEFFEEIRRGDILVHHPYESFATSFEAFVRGSGKDRNVLGLKTTVYRTSDETPLVPALIDAAEEGKQTVCLVELKARFDEHRNIEWSRALERAGVHVVYGFPNLKIHAKATLIVRREGNDLRRYVHIGTGNYHAINARAYEDFGLFTADPEIGADVADLFNYLTGFGRPQRFRKLLVAPFALRARLIEEIRAVAQSAEAGKKAVIRIKVNALTDQAVIEELYEASQAGAEIDIVARGVCALRPGVPGMSENIRVRSIVGRFLEHSRLFILESNKKSTYLLGSADLMPRNLDHRLEIVVPVEDSYAQQRLASVFDALLSDNAQAWELGSDGTWERIKTAKDERPKPAHAALMRSVRARFRRRAEPPRRGR
ncbi:MAG TPA: polyphosphate kinase 1 [Gaiellaceae bacterium]|nr:polyphosphate kinase 1 [Gaiellaceae bacterium]